MCRPHFQCGSGASNLLYWALPVGSGERLALPRHSTAALTPSRLRGAHPSTRMGRSSSPSAITHPMLGRVGLPRWVWRRFRHVRVMWANSASVMLRVVLPRGVRRRARHLSSPLSVPGAFTPTHRLAHPLLCQVGTAIMGFDNCRSPGITRHQRVSQQPMARQWPRALVHELAAF